MKIGFVGLGIMGESMSENIVKKHDDEVYVFDFVKEKVELLESKGAIGCSSSLELAEKSDVIISMVPKSEHSMAVYKEVLPALDDTKLCIDMSTIDPSVSVEISEMVKKTGAEFVDAPVVEYMSVEMKKHVRRLCRFFPIWEKISSGWAETEKVWL